MKKSYNNWNKEELILEIEKLYKRKKFGLVWEDKPEEVVEDCKKKIPILERDKSKSIKNHNTKTNIIIEGDNYHTLSVLNYTHKGKIDGIYIDPPYNTGSSDWKYNNNYVDQEDPYRHTKWISFIHNRLKITKDLLKEDGIICITIDDHELPRLIMIMEEVYGENNHLGTICIRNNPSGRSTMKGISINHEYAIFFSKSPISKVGRLPRNEKQINRYPEKDKKGYYEEVNFRKGGGIRKESPKMFYPLFISNNSWRIPKMNWNNDKKEWILNEKVKRDENVIYPVDDLGREKRWKWALERVKNESDELFVRKVKGENHIFHKNRMSHNTVLPNTWWDKKEYSATDHGTRLLKEMFGELKTFDYPKAVEAVKDCLRVLSGNKDAVFLDFFAGSGTTGHAVLELNKEDNGNRSFILGTNNENNISEDACFPRIKKAIQGYKNQKNINIKGLGGSLEYFKTKFIPYGHSDQNKILLAKKASDILCLKEEIYDEYISKIDYKIYKKENKYIFIVYDQLSIEKIKKLITQYNAKIKIYVFSLGGDLFEEEFEEFNNVEIFPMPEPILATYKRLFL